MTVSEVEQVLAVLLPAGATLDDYERIVPGLKARILTDVQSELEHQRMMGRDNIAVRAADALSGDWAQAMRDLSSVMS